MLKTVLVKKIILKNKRFRLINILKHIENIFFMKLDKT